MMNQNPILRSADAHGQPDAWHAHAASEGRPMEAHTQSVDISILLKWLVGLLVALTIVIFAVVKFFDATRMEYVQTQVETNVLAQEYTVKRDGLDAELSTNGKERRFGGLVDQKVQIPIEDGMQRVIAGYAGGSAKLPALHTSSAGAIHTEQAPGK
jgi:hypothetical protein